MDRMIYLATSGAKQTMEQQATVAHNLANVSSTGYRAEEHRLRAAQVQSKSASALPTRAFAADATTHTPLPMAYCTALASVCEGVVPPRLRLMICAPLSAA